MPMGEINVEIDQDFLERQLSLVEGTTAQVDPEDLTSIIRPFLVRNKIPIEDIVPYCERILRDWKELKPFLPIGKRHIVNIGSSFGGHDLYLGKHYDNPKYRLIDGMETIQKKQTGFREDAQPYRNGRLGYRLLKTNGLDVQFYPVGEATNKMTFPQLDFVVSFCAWLHHFPVHAYLPLVQRSLISGGHLLVDIRIGTNGKEQLEVSGFEVVNIIKEKLKFTRILFVKR